MVQGETIHIGDVSPKEAWERLGADPRSVLVDVRTRAEWAFVGIPDLAALNRRVVAVEWQTFPDSRIDPQFVERLQAALASQGTTQTDEIFFICRSGGRSRMAAEAMAEAGYGRCSNVAEGFEGSLDDQRHRGRLTGWKNDGLPWIQG